MLTKNVKSWILWYRYGVVVLGMGLNDGCCVGMIVN